MNSGELMKILIEIYAYRHKLFLLIVNIIKAFLKFLIFDNIFDIF